MAKLYDIEQRADRLFNSCRSELTRIRKRLNRFSYKERLTSHLYKKARAEYERLYRLSEALDKFLNS